MSKRTLTPLVIFSQTNLVGNESDLGSGIDFFDDRWLDWDGNGNCNFRVRFLDCVTAPQTGADLQTIRVLVRRSSLSGSNVINADFNLNQNGSTILTLGNADITNTTSEIFTFTFNANLLTDSTGAACELIIDQTAGGTGQNRSGFDVGACEFIYEDGIGTRRLVRHRACDGSCCVAAPRFPNGAGTPEDPHQGSDCIHHIAGIGKQFHGCALIEDAAQQPVPGIKSLLKGMEAVDALDIFLETCVNWPQNTGINKDLGNCCWIWEDDV